MKEVRKKTIKRWTLLLLFWSLFLLGGIFSEQLSQAFRYIFTTTSSAEDKQIYVKDSGWNTYQEMLRQVYSDRRVALVPKEKIYLYMSSGKSRVVEMSELQAKPLMDVGRLLSWSPHYVSTIVIAVDRDVVTDEILGWSDLQLGMYPVYIEDVGLSMTAIATGLDEGFRMGTDWQGYPVEHRQTDFLELDNTVNLLQNLNKDGRLIFNKEREDIFTHAPVVILDNNRAERFQNKGKNMEIIFPEEGTLSVTYGLGVLQSYKNPELAEKISGEITKQSPLVEVALRKGKIRVPRSGFFGKYRSPGNKYNQTYHIKDIQEYNDAYYSILGKFESEVEGIRALTNITGLGIIADYILLIIGVVLWSTLIQIRIVDDQVRRCLMEISFLLALWLGIRLMKFLVFSNDLTRWLWYGYYIPLIGIPTIWAVLCLQISGSSRLCRYKKVFIGISIFLIALVLTNDFHQQVFRFTENLRNRNMDYEYGIGYQIIVGWLFLLSFGSVLLLIRRKTGRADKSRRWAPLTVFVLTVVYHVMYILRIPLVFRGDMTMVYVVLICLFLESMLYIGLIQGNGFYQYIFENVNRHIYLLSRKKETVLKTKVSPVLPPAIKGASFSNPGEINKILWREKGIFYNIGTLQGGYALWEEDLRQLVAMKQQLESNAQELLEKHKLIMEQYMARKNLYRMKVRNQLMDEIEGAIAGKVEAITNMTETLYEGETKSERLNIRKKITYIKMMISYCKRISYFMMISKQKPDISMEEIVKALRETLQDSEVVGMEHALILQEKGEVPVEDALFIYDYIYSIIEQALSYKKPLAFINLKAEKRKTRLKMVLSSDREVIDPEKFQIREELRIAMIALKYEQHMEVEYNSLEIYLRPIRNNEEGIR